MNIENIQIEDIKPYVKNAKKHDERQIKNVMESIKQFGFAQPLVIDKDNVLIIGHCRLIAAKRLKHTTVPVLRMDELSQDQVDKLRLLDNKLNESEWDFDLLAEDVPSLDFSDFDIDWGLPEEEETVEEIIEDEVPDVPEEVKSQLGDLWILGEHRLICGDSTDVAVVDRLMDGVKADMVFTDPPYGMKKESEGVLNDNLNFDDLLDFNRQWIPLTFGALKDNGSWYCWGIDEPLMDIYSNILKPMQKNKQIAFRNLITWDKGNGQGQLSEDFRMYPIADEKCLFVMCGQCGFTEKRENTEWVIPIVEKIKEKAKKYGLIAKDMRVAIGHSANGADHFTSFRIFRFPQREYYEQWFDDGGYDELKREYEKLRAEHEEGRTYFDNTHDNMNNVWHFDRAGKDERKHTGGHATPKPIVLCSRAIKSSSREGEIVLDVFGGSGSTLIACEQLNRKCYMCELDPHYVDVILQRYVNFKGTDEDVYLIRDGEMIKYKDVI